MCRTRYEALAGARHAIATKPEADQHRRYWLLTLRMGELVTAALEQWADEALEEFVRYWMASTPHGAAT